MHPTEIRLATNIKRWFDYHWMVQAKIKLKPTEAEKILSERGIDICSPESILTPTFEEEPFELPPPIVAKEGPPCYFFKKGFFPIDKLKQVQNLTNTLVFDSLPKRILDKLENITEEEEEYFHRSFCHAYLLDGEQKKLPRFIDTINRPGINLPRIYGIPFDRGNKLFTSHLLIRLAQKEKQKRLLIEDCLSRATIDQQGKILHFQYTSPYAVFSPTPLEPVIASDRLSEFDGVDLPDIDPLSPLANCYPETIYPPLENGFGLLSNRWAPHTLFHHFNLRRVVNDQDFFAGLTLLHAFTHAAAYARQLYPGINGDLDHPITINVIHSHQRIIHTSVFQLNTLTLGEMNGGSEKIGGGGESSGRRNFFWNHPWDVLYELGDCNFVECKPQVTLSAEAFSRIKALYNS